MTFEQMLVAIADAMRRAGQLGTRYTHEEVIDSLKNVLELSEDEYMAQIATADLRKSLVDSFKRCYIAWLKHHQELDSY